VIAVSDLDESHIALARITDALFCSDLVTGEAPSRRQVTAAIRRALREHRTWNGCTRAVAAAFANTPSQATQREAWCSELAKDVLLHTDILSEADDWA
jgi:hypothetical protein